MAWPPTPSMLPRRAAFDELVLEALERLESRIGRSLEPLEIAVEDVPPSDPSSWEDAVPLGRLFPAHGRTQARVVLYRRPIAARCTSERELAALVEHVVVQQVAALTGLHPEDLEGRS